MNAKILQKHDNLYHIIKNYTLKSIYNDENECINYMLSHSLAPIRLVTQPVDWVKLVLNQLIYMLI